MGVPIPQDWNGDDWRCYQVQIPDSLEWRAIFFGLMTLATRGRYWDRDTGTITDAQTVGWEIFDRIAACESTSPDPPVSPELIETILTIMCCEEVEEMPCGLDPCLFKIENGVLSVRDACGAWAEIGALHSPAEVTAPAPPSVDPTDPETWNACGKASFLIDTIRAMVIAAAPYFLDYNIWEYESDVRSAAPWATMGRTEIYALIGTMQTVGAFIGDAEWQNDFYWNQAKCKALVGMNDDPNGSQAEVDFVRNSIWSVYSPLIDVEGRSSVKNMFDYAFNALGENDCIQALIMGASILDATCCDSTLLPTGPEFASSMGYYLGEPIAENVVSTDERIQRARGTFELAHDLFGLVMKYSAVNYTTTIKPMAYTDIGSLPYDPTAVQLWGDTSGQFHLDPPGSWYVFQDTAGVVIDIISKYGLENALQSTAGTWSANPAVPGTNKNVSDAIVLGWEIARETAPVGDFGPLTIEVIYPIFNIGSPSHA
jgi:hypothetical protein